MGKTIKASEAVFGEWYRCEKWGIVRCVDTGTEEQLPMFVLHCDGVREHKFLHSCELVHLPECDSFEWEETVADNPNGVRWFVDPSCLSDSVWCYCDFTGDDQKCFSTRSKNVSRSWFWGPLNVGPYQEITTDEALARIGANGWAEGVAEARKLAGLRPAVTEGSVVDFLDKARERLDGVADSYREWTLTGMPDSVGECHVWGRKTASGIDTSDDTHEDGRWNSVEPGEGWRLVKPGEELIEGDESYDDEYSEWFRRMCHGMVHSEGYRPQRRRITSDTPDPGEGYRLIDQSKDAPCEGDEMLMIGTGLWEERTECGQPFTASYYYRRRIDYSQWQEPVGVGGAYPLPVGTVIELKGDSSIQRIVVVDKPDDGNCNAIWEGSSIPVWNGGVHRWRVAASQTDSPPFKVGDWVRSNWAGIIPAKEIAKVEKISDGMVTVSYMGGRMRTTSSVGYFYKPDYRPFADASEFAPYRDRWIVSTTGKAKGTISAVTHYTDSHVNGIPYDTLMYCRTFEDGTQCGVEVME